MSQVHVPLHSTANCPFKKAGFLHFHRGHVFLIPWGFAHLWTLSNMSTCFFKCGTETWQNTPSDVSLVLSKME